MHWEVYWSSCCSTHNVEPCGTSTMEQNSSSMIITVVCGFPLSCGSLNFVVLVIMRLLFAASSGPSPL